jgi:hypothetical protein
MKLQWYGPMLGRLFFLGYLSNKEICLSFIQLIRILHFLKFKYPSQISNFQFFQSNPNISVPRYSSYIY